MYKLAKELTAEAKLQPIPIKLINMVQIFIFGHQEKPF
jgi:hypothetical protein